MTACTVWRPRPGVRVNLRADSDELKRTCRRDYETEELLLARLRAQIGAETWAARFAIERLSRSLEGPSPILRCPRCRSRFIAWKNSHGDWAARCRRCTPKGKRK